ncbi:S16 family serine protease [Streptomyces phytophilus]|uniref:S16 family serine protease n=1 Tax=Streptomyces phytophilus TaxID=722715 RepID=UPI0015EFF218|nr:S16 family serine protease [Streptomyces phytophilus]
MTLALCAAPVAGLLAAAAFAPLPFSLAKPGMTADVLGDHQGSPVITVSGAEQHATDGELRMTTIAATGPEVDLRLADIASGWFATDEAVMPKDAVYPVGDSRKEIREYNAEQMRESQNTAVTAALNHLGRKPGSVDVELRLTDVGGPSAGLFFALGIVDKLGPDDLTGGKVIAGTGTIARDGTVGPVGGVALKTLGAKRDGATVFLVPKAECSDAESELPEGLRLVPVEKLSDAVASLKALKSGGDVPGC